MNNKLRTIISDNLKATIVFEAYENHRYGQLKEVAEKYGVNPATIRSWKNKIENSSEMIFSKKLIPSYNISNQTLKPQIDALIEKNTKLQIVIITLFKVIKEMAPFILDQTLSILIKELGKKEINNLVSKQVNEKNDAA